VTGTNGKGSVCAFLTAIWCHVGGANRWADDTTGGGLRLGGEGPLLKVGRFTSPHLVDWRESITVNERMISVPHFDAVLRAIHAQMQRTRIPLTQAGSLLPPPV
jgi:dihydrofolate synthase/folylpolyglutamate synthase